MKIFKEIRVNPVNLRVADCADGCETVSRTIAGTAIVFNSQSELLAEDGLRFYETIVPEAVTNELIGKSDIVMLYNHKKEAGVLARSKYGNGTLRINITNTGVDFEFESPCSSLGDSMLESIKRGDLDAMSFAFYVKQGTDIWLKAGELWYRTIKTIEALADFSIVINPAYTATSVNARSLKEHIANEEKELEAQRTKDAEILEVRKAEIKTYYDNLYQKK